VLAVPNSKVIYFIAKRLLNSVFVMLALSVLIFLFLRAIPGDPVMTMLGESESTPETYQQLRAKLGLDQPLYVQYGSWLNRVLHGDLGNSIHTSRPVLEVVIAKFKSTLELAFLAVFLGSLLGMIAGTVSAVKSNSVFDTVAMVGSLVGISMPVFWLGILLLIVFSVQFDWLPISGMISYDTVIHPVTGFPMLDALITGNVKAAKDLAAHIILPAITLGVVPAALTARTTRASMLDVIHEDYIRAGLARGLSYFEVLYKHAFRNALIPVATVIGLQIGVYLGGSIVTETVFSWPGLGRQVIQAIYDRDYPMVQGAILVYAFVIVLVNLMVDLFYAYIDPRVKL
jgi:peptide/nickel transport system permease protein